MKKTANVRIPELEAEIKSTVHAIMQTVTAGGTGPLTSPEAAKFHFGTHHHRLQALIDKTSTVLQLKSGGFSANRTLEYIAMRQEKCRDTVRTGDERLIDLAGFLRESAALPSPKRKLMQVLLVLLASADSTINTGALEAMLGMTYIGSVLTAVAMAGTFAYCAHSLIPKFWDTDDPGARSRNQTLTFIGAVLLFAVLGYARAEYGNFPKGSSVVVNVLGYTFLSLLFFFAACGIGVSLRRARAKRKDAEIEKAEEELAETKRAVKDAKAELRRLETEHPTVQAEAAMRYEYGCGLVEQIVSEGKRAYLKFLRAGARGGIDPDSFDTTYPFEFRLEIRPIHGNHTGRGMATAVLALAVAGSALLSCSDGGRPAGDTAMVVLCDTTDELPEYPDTASVMPLAMPDGHLWDGVSVEVGTIGETDVSPTYTHTLPREDRLFSNLQERQRKTAAFKENLHGSLLKIRPRKGGETGKSLVYGKIAKSAAKLKAMDYGHKYLVVYSDLMENGTVSFYDKRYRKLLADDPDSLEHILTRQEPLDDLSGVSILFIYGPGSYEDNVRHTAVSGFFEWLFEKHGADVTVQATLNR